MACRAVDVSFNKMFFAIIKTSGFISFHCQLVLFFKLAAKGSEFISLQFDIISEKVAIIYGFVTKQKENAFSALELLLKCNSYNDQNLRNRT